MLKERWTPQIYTKFPNLTSCLVACTQQTITDGCLNEQNCTSSIRIHPGPQGNTGLLWITHSNHVSSLTRILLRAQRHLQSSGRVPLVQPIISMTSYKVSQPMCAVTTVFFMFFCVHQVHPLNVVLPCCASLGVAPMSETIVCARWVCRFLELFTVMVCMFLLYLTKYVKLPIQYKNKRSL